MDPEDLKLQNERKLYQLHKKGYEDIQKAIVEQKKESNTTIIIDGEDVEQVKMQGEPGKDGKTPKKGVDYFTEAEQKAFVEEIMSRLPKIKDGEPGKDGDPGRPGKDAVVDYNKILDYVKREVAKIPKPQAEKIDYNSIIARVLEKTPKVFPEAVDYEAVKDFIKKEVKSLNLEEIVGRQRGGSSEGDGRFNSPGVRMRLEDVSDVEVEGVAVGQVLTWDGDKWIPQTNSAGGVDSVNEQTGAVVLDADDIDDTSTTQKFVTAGDLTKLGNLSGTNTGDVTVSDTAEIDLALTGQALSASIVASSIDESKLDASVNASLDLADSSLQPANISDVTYDDTSWNGVTTIAPSKNAIRDKINTMDTAINLKAPLDSPNFTKDVVITVADNDNVIGLTVNQNDVTNYSDTALLQTTSSDQYFAPVLRFYTNHTAAAGQDGSVGTISYRGNDSAGNETVFATMYAGITDNTNGSEDGSYGFNVMYAGTQRRMLYMAGGTNGITVGNSTVGDAIVQSSGNNDLILKTGNATTGTITIADGANGNISITPNGTGTVVLPAATSIGTVSATELGYVDGVTSAIQTQLDAKATDEMEIMALLGSTYKATTVGISLGEINATLAFSDAQIRFVPVYLRKAQTITGVKWYQKVQGDYTADNNNRIGLYSYSGGTLTLVASCANDGNLWKATSETFGTKAFSSTYAASAGLYFVGLLYNQSAQTTAPSIGASTATTNLASVSYDFTNSAKLFSFVGSKSDLDSSIAMSGLTAVATRPWVALY